MTFRKDIYFPTELPDGEPSQYLLDPGVKTACDHISSQVEIYPEVREYIENLEPEEGKVYVLAIAMGAGEFWGCNYNADYFPWDQLNPIEEGAAYGYKSFLNAKIFRKHKNKKNSPSYGKVVFAAFNEKMGRVEVIYYLDADNPANAKTIENMDNGIFPQMSMGCGIAYDICSICGHKSSGPKKRCIHIPRQLNNIYHDGRKVMMINIRPKFFDLSIVDIMADPIAWSVKKVAAAHVVKFSEMVKTVPAGEIVTHDLKKFLIEAMRIGQEYDGVKDIPVEQLMHKHSPMSLLNGMMLLGMKPKPREFCSIMKQHVGEGQIPFDTFEPSIPDNIPMDLFSAFKNMMSDAIKAPPVLDDLEPHLDNRSAAAPFIIRVVVRKKMPEKEVTIEEKDEVVADEKTAMYNIVNNMYFMLGNDMPSTAIKCAGMMGYMSRGILSKVVKMLRLDKMSQLFQVLVSYKPEIAPVLKGALVAAYTLKSEQRDQYQPVNANMLLATYADAMTGLPAAVNAGMFNQMTEKTASMLAKFVLPPLAAYTMSGYLKSKQQRNAVLTPTQQFLKNYPELTAIAIFMAPAVLGKLGLPEAGMLAGAGLAGYGAGQVFAKTSGLNKVYDENILLDRERDVKLAAAVMTEMQPEQTKRMLRLMATLLTGFGLGAIVGVDPVSDPEPTTPAYPSYPTNRRW